MTNPGVREMSLYIAAGICVLVCVGLVQPSLAGDKSATTQSAATVPATAPATPRQAVYAERTKALTYKSDDGMQLPYRLFVPAGYDPNKKYPLVLALHGAGGRGADNLRQLVDSVAGWTGPMVQDKHPCFIVMPQCPAGKQWVDTPWQRGSYDSATKSLTPTLRFAKEIMENVIKDYSVDRSRLYVVGASMGGYGTWDIIARYPETFAAAVPVCGAGDPKAASKLTSLPIWVFHGDQDKTVPFSGSQEMVNAIEKAGGKKVKFTVYKGVKHESYQKFWKEQELVEWLFAQERNPQSTTRPAAASQPGAHSKPTSPVRVIGQVRHHHATA